MPKNVDALANYSFVDIREWQLDISIHIWVHGKVFKGNILAEIERGHFSPHAWALF